MVNAQALLADLTKLLKRLEADLLARVQADQLLFVDGAYKLPPR